MKKKLIIVESPAKSKTLRKFLGAEYIVESSVGHVRDLPEKGLAVDIANDFEPTYEILPHKQEVIARLKKAASQADIVYLSPDPDREGEAIAWHIREILPKKIPTKRVSFNAITKEAVRQGIAHPRDIDMSLVDAQQARRILDRLVGYKISPFLNRRIARGKDGFLSAGRVQSVALKLVVDREKEIAAFKPVEYWNLGAILATREEPNRPFRASLYSVDGKKVEKELIEGKEVYLIGSEQTARMVSARIQEGPFEIAQVEKKEKRRHPVPPFITSTLQQEASRYYRFSPAKTMGIAQGLYEGVDLGSEGTEGLITYMRTDSVRIVPEALSAARSYIRSQFGEEFLPAEAKVYASKKSAQDAHEAIRPTNIEYTPERVEKFLTREQFLLYQLIWKRFLASQMMPAVYDTVTAEIRADQGIVLRATGSIIKFSGFLALYEEKEDDRDGEGDEFPLPPLHEGQRLDLRELLSEQAFTRPPPRYTEASLVKELEKSGIGRPSTYAAIMNKIQSREYTVKEQGRLRPTELGEVIAQMLESSFPDVMNVGFTAKMEDALEAVAENKKEWKGLIREFWAMFEPALERALKEAYVPRVTTEIVCPKCAEGKLQKIWAKSKYFYGCSRYPECDYSAPIEEVAFNKEDYAENFNWEQPCPKCSGAMKVRHGRYGAFLGCVTYPACKGIVNIPKRGEEIPAHQDLPSCPAIGCEGKLVARRSRFGKVFYSCSTFPDCDVIVNTLEQVEEKYPNHPRAPYQKKGAKAARAGARARAPKNKQKDAARPAKPAKKKEETKRDLTPALASLVGAQALPRAQVLKRVWEYIKSQGLQDPADKRMIVPDAALAAALGTQDPVHMLKLPGLLDRGITRE